MEPKGLRFACRDPVFPGRFEQRVGPADVRLDERRRSVDRAVDMAFRCEVKDRIWFVPLEYLVQGGAVTDIGLLEGVTRGIRHLRDIGEVRGIGEGVEIDDIMARTDSVAHHSRADEACTSGYENLHAASHTNGLSKSASAGAAASFSESTGSPSSPQSMPQVSQRTAPSAAGA